MASGLGGAARWLAAAAALLLTLGVMNVYYAGAAKLGAALGRDGALPAWLSRGSAAGEVPRRSLGVVSGMGLLALGAVTATGVGTEPLVLLTTGSFVTVYAIGVAAAIKLLPRGSKGRAAAFAALVAVLGLLVMSGWYLLWPLVVATAALLYVRRSSRSRPRPTAVSPAAAP
jgi:amino acid efflux transporter